jgi:hypothetical protein
MAHHGRDAEGKTPGLQALQIRQLRLQLLHLRQDGLGPIEQHLAAVGQGEAATDPAQQGWPSSSSMLRIILLMVGWVTNSFSEARVKLCSRTSSTK